MSRPDSTNGSASVKPDPRTNPSKLPDPPLRSANFTVVPEIYNPADRTLTRSPQLFSLPENEVTGYVGTGQNASTVTDFAHPNRQDTGSTSSISENSYMARSDRSSTAGHGYQPLLSQKSSENALHTTRHEQLHVTWFEAFRDNLITTQAFKPNTMKRAPTDFDFASIRQTNSSLVWKIRTYNSSGANCDIVNVVVFLHGIGGDESTWMPFAKQHLGHPQTVLIFLGGLPWSDEGPDGTNFQKAIDLVTDSVVRDILMEKCNFSLGDIAFIGQGQGGIAALTIACAWSHISLAGIISIDGPLPDYITHQADVPKSCTPILLIGGKLGALTPQAEQKIRDMFQHVDAHLQTEVEVLRLEVLHDLSEVHLVAEFLDYALRHEEWNTQAVLTFDGGGIRGYGSLLVMKELMRHIGQEEKRLDRRATSSFHPGIYKPTIGIFPEGSRPPTADCCPPQIVETSTEGLEDSDLFLPCHYFTYIGGTSTGGLISIMLSRFRMTVNDCISEYKSLGERVFAHPRPLSTAGLLWHKFGREPLRNAIQDVADRRCYTERSLGGRFPSDPDFCRTVVLAYSEKGTTDAPYLFRTYETFSRHGNGQEPQPGVVRRATTHSLRHAKIHNPGAPSDVEITLVGLATTAAPTKFPPVRIQMPDASFSTKAKTRVRFKDGGFGSNNPSSEVYKDVINKHGGLSKNVSIVVSVGTGKSEVKLFGKEANTRAGTRIREAVANFKAALRHPSRTEGAHEHMLELSRQDNKPIFSYFRLDGGARLGLVKMDEWKSGRLANMMKLKHTKSGSKTLQQIEEAVTIYLASASVQRQLSECARLLVRRRRLRLRDTHPWDRYASASWYECPYITCKDSAELKTFADFENHVKKDHSREYDTSSLGMEELAKKNRRCWIYPKTET